MSLPLRRVFPLLAAAAMLAATVVVPAQLRLRPITDQTGDTALELALRKLHTVGTLMMTTAHPDDENNGLLALMAHGEGLRTVLVTATRGDGGQNEIGPEIFDALAVLRTEELLAAHRFDGAEQYFTRAVDFGYSFSIDETYAKWGRDAIVGDFVRHIRTIRPDVIAGFLWDGMQGGLHHQASTHLAQEAYLAAADPTRYPDQIAAGLRPWQVAKFYYTGGGGPGGGRGGRGTGPAAVPVGSNVFDDLLGRTYDEIGVEARTMHRCQDTSQLLPLPGGRGGGRGYVLQECAIAGQKEKTETSLLDGLDLSLPALATRFGGATPPAMLQSSLRSIDTAVNAATGAFKSGQRASIVTALAMGLHELRALRAALPSMGLGDDGRYEIDFRLAQKERQFQDALLAAAGVRLDVVADDMTVTRGQAVNVQLFVANRGAAPITLKSATAGGGPVINQAGAQQPLCRAGAIAPNATQTCQEALVIPADAKWTDSGFKHGPEFDRYVPDPDVPFGLPFPPSPYRATFSLTIGGEPVEKTLTVEARSGEDMSAGEKRSELLVVPALTVTVSPDVVVVPTGTAATREMRVTVRNNVKTAAAGDVRLTLPAGWTATPASIPVSFARGDEESTVRFTVSTPAGLKAGSAVIGADATSGGASFSTGFQTVEYPHIRRRLLFKPAEATVRVIDVKVAGRQNVGYVMGAGDKVPNAIQQLGVPVTLLTADDLAWGDLSKYTVIMTGVRAYGNRPDLEANNQRLLEYVRNGGTVLVNYNRTEFNQAQYGPYPATTSNNRVTDERAPVRILVPDHPAFTTPNRIGPSTWDNWVQERGTYFLSTQAKEYVDLLESEDPFPNNAGPKRGVLVEAKLGKGRWIYIGLVLWRELPAAVPGSYQLLANLVSLGRPVSR